MSLSEKDMNHLCKLAKINPDAEHRALYAKQCAEIISYMDELSEVDTSSREGGKGVEPMYTPVAHLTAYREDLVLKKRTREEILANAPSTDGNYFIVPRIVEGQ